MNSTEASPKFCPSTFYDGECEDGRLCSVLDTCPNDACIAGQDCVCTRILDPWEQIGQPACGTHACCKPDNGCEDLPRDECISILEEDTGNPAVWNNGDFCFLNGQRCPYFSCFYSSVACTACFDPFHVCQTDQDCIDWIGDVFPETYCRIEESVCLIPKGCTNVFCCDWVCQQAPLQESAGLRCGLG